MAGGGGVGVREFEVKRLWWSWECGEPPPVWSNHSWLSIILPPPLSPSNPSPRLAASLLPAIISSSLVRELGWHLAALLLSPPLSISHPLLPVQWLVYGGWLWANSISLPTPSATQPAASSSHRREVILFCVLRTSSPSPHTQPPISSSVTTVFHLLAAAALLSPGGGCAEVQFYTSLWAVRWCCERKCWALWGFQELIGNLENYKCAFDVWCWVMQMVESNKRAVFTAAKLYTLTCAQRLQLPL